MSLKSERRGCNLPSKVGLVLTFLYATLSSSGAAEKLDFTSAVLSYRYQDVKTGQMVKGKDMQGFFGLVSRLESEEGRLVHVLTEDGANHGCSELQNVPSKGKWIALIERGQCKFHDKIVRAAVEGNASAVIVYDHEHSEELLAMSIYEEGIVAVFVRKADGELLANLADSGLPLVLNISLGQHFSDWFNGTTVIQTSSRNNIMLMTTLTFLLVLILGVIGLLIYVARRSKYIRNKHRTHMVFTLQENGQVGENLLPAAQQALNRDQQDSSHN